MTIEIKTLESRKETIEATIGGEVVVRAVRWDEPSRSYSEHFAPPEADHPHWIIDFPRIASMVGHEIHEIHVFNDPRIDVEAFAKLIAKAQS
jgi:hypothetical protein